MSLLVVTHADVGRTVAHIATLRGVRFVRTATRGAVGGLFSLIDASATGVPPRALFTCDIPVRWFLRSDPVEAHDLLVDAAISFVDLTVQDVPFGGRFEIEVASRARLQLATP
jgi:hypothetical protein